MSDDLDLKKPVDERFKACSEFVDSGPITIAECDCHDCEEDGSLNSEMCRWCVFEGLGGEGEVDRVVLKKEFHNIYSNSTVSELAGELADIKMKVFDRSLYSLDDKTENCKSCISKRIDKMEEFWPLLIKNPHDFSLLDGILEGENLSSSKCKICTEKNFLELVKTIRTCLNEISILGSVSKEDYDSVLGVLRKPFFVEGVWDSPRNNDKKLVDSYNLPDGRGKVRIYRQNDSPVPFYDLKLPEFELPNNHAKLLKEAFRMEIDSAPSHARFAKPTKMVNFAEDWYNALLHIVRDRDGIEIASSTLKELSERIANWLNYKILEPLSRDENLTDIYIEAPPELQPVRVVHRRWGNCETGIYWSSSSLLGLAEILASKLGRSFDEPNPQLDAEIPELGLRLFISRYPAVWVKNSASAAIRKRRSRPWTQLLFMERGSITPLASAFVSNLIRKGSSIFIIGDIGTAKTSYLITQIPEIGLSERIITFQDTEEIQFEKFVNQDYELENVRVSNAGHLRDQINSFLRGGSAYWLITEVRSLESVKSALSAAARRGGQPVLSTFHADTKRQMYDLICNLMDLHNSAYKYIDFIISTSKFDTSEGTIRRVTEISEILKDWEDSPEYVTLFSDNRKKDLLQPENVFQGPEKLVNEVNSFDLTGITLEDLVNELDFLPPEEGGSKHISRICSKFALDKKDFLAQILSEAKMKSKMLMLARKKGKRDYLELPFVRKSYGKYFSEMKQHAPEYDLVLENWLNWLEDNT